MAITWFLKGVIVSTDNFCINDCEIGPEGWSEMVLLMKTNEYCSIHWFPLIIPSLINLLVQSQSHLYKNCRRVVLVWFLVTPQKTTRKWDNALVLLGFKPQQPLRSLHTTKNDHPIGREKTGD